jgi:sugar O-acyltransferase (sialic acid O-acetyltransferase NeuD family)
MKGLLIAGAGGHGKVVAEAAQATGLWERIAFVDDRHAQLADTLGWPVLGGIDDAYRFRAEYADAVVAIGNAAVRLQVMDRLAAQGFGLPVVIHPSAWVSPSAALGEGTVVFAMAAINACTVIGRGGIVNTGATVDHDCRIGDGVHVCPGAHVAGDVALGDGVWVGIGASVANGLHVGADAIIGAGAVVVSDVEDGVTVAGVPAKVIRRHVRGG